MTFKLLFVSSKKFYFLPLAWNIMILFGTACPTPGPAQNNYPTTFHLPSHNNYRSSFYKTPLVITKKQDQASLFQVNHT